MAITWTEKDGKFVARDEYQPKSKEGTPLGGVQVAEAEGTTKEEALSALLEVKNSNYGNLYLKSRDWKKEAELGKAPTAPVQPTVEFKPRAFTAEEKLRLSKAAGIDPEKADEFAELIFEAKFGMKPAVATQRLNDGDKRSQLIRNFQVCNAWALDHPEYNSNSNANNQAMAKWIEVHKGNVVTPENLDEAYAALSEVLDQPVSQAALPAGDTPAAAGNKGNSSPNGNGDGRIATSGNEAAEPQLPLTVTRQQASPSENVPSNQLTKAMIDAMSAAEYDKRMKDPAFIKRVNELFARPSSR